MNNFLTKGVIAADACESNNDSLFSVSEMYLYEMIPQGSPLALAVGGIADFNFHTIYI